MSVSLDEKLAIVRSTEGKARATLIQLRQRFGYVISSEPYPTEIHVHGMKRERWVRTSRPMGDATEYQIDWSEKP